MKQEMEKYLNLRAELKNAELDLLQVMKNNQCILREWGGYIFKYVTTQQTHVTLDNLEEDEFSQRLTGEQKKDVRKYHRAKAILKKREKKVENLKYAKKQKTARLSVTEKPKDAVTVD